ncbi:MAG: hypothetical protein LAT63_09670 [Marinobacter sp.]|nr:hypothetical protein [Marinobacter sp.]
MKITFTGIAESLTGTPLYEEHHQVIGECRGNRWHPTQHSVSYKDPGTAEAFASKELTYDLATSRPSFIFEQPRFDERLSVQNREDRRLAIEWQSPEGRSERFRVDIDQRVVVDAGFDQYIRDNYQALARGDSLRLRFLAPTRGAHYAFIAEPVQDRRVDAPLTVQIRASGLLSRWFVDPILLGYDEQGFLTDYVGLTNVRMNNDENFTAHIRYRIDQAAPGCD